MTISPTLTLPETDQYYGLLTKPPGTWWISCYGSIKAIILQGTPHFIRRAFNMLSSYTTGPLLGTQMVRPDALMVPMSEERILKTLSLWFWTQLFPSMAHYDKDNVFVPDNLAQINRAASHVANQFYSNEMPHCTLSRFLPEENVIGGEYAVSIWDTQIATD